MITDETFKATLEHFLKPILPLMEKQEVTEVMINSREDIWVEEKGLVHKAEDYRFDSDEDLMAAVTNIAQYVGHHIRPDTARFDARLPWGHRVHIVLPPVSRNGISVTIRKHKKGSLSLDDLVDKYKSLTVPARDFLRLCLELEKNVIVSGGTGTGKTTLLNALSSLIPDGARILTLEDSAELQLQQQHVVSLQTKPADRHGEGGVSIRDLLHSCLRMRPDRIIVGECRGGEALDLLQALNTGHGGSMSTVHANSTLEAMRRLETLALFAGEEIPLKFIRAQVASAVHIVVQLMRLGGRRLVQAIAETRGLNEDGDYVVVEIFTFDPQRDALLPTGEKPSFDASTLDAILRVSGKAAEGDESTNGP